MNTEKNQWFLMKKEMNCGGWQENLIKNDWAEMQ